jgi:ankyrin repeat protein
MVKKMTYTDDPILVLDGSIEATAKELIESGDIDKLNRFLMKEKAPHAALQYFFATTSFGPNSEEDINALRADILNSVVEPQAIPANLEKIHACARGLSSNKGSSFFNSEIHNTKVLLGQALYNIFASQRHGEAAETTAAALLEVGAANWYNQEQDKKNFIGDHLLHALLGQAHSDVATALFRQHYDFCRTLWPSQEDNQAPALYEVPNGQGVTPITLAAQFGYWGYFNEFTNNYNDDKKAEVYQANLEWLLLHNNDEAITWLVQKQGERAVVAILQFAVTDMQKLAYVAKAINSIGFTDNSSQASSSSAPVTKQLSRDLTENEERSLNRVLQRILTSTRSAEDLKTAALLFQLTTPQGKTITDIFIQYSLKGDADSLALFPGWTALQEEIQKVLMVAPAKRTIPNYNSGYNSTLASAILNDNTFGKKRTSLINPALRNGANPNLILDGKGNTALHIAIEKNYWKVALLLMLYGADKNMTNIRLATPLALISSNHEPADFYNDLQKNKIHRLPLLVENEDKTSQDFLRSLTVIYDFMADNFNGQGKETAIQHVNVIFSKLGNPTARVPAQVTTSLFIQMVYSALRYKYTTDKKVNPDNPVDKIAIDFLNAIIAQSNTATNATDFAKRLAAWCEAQQQQAIEQAAVESTSPAVSLEDSVDASKANLLEDINKNMQLLHTDLANFSEKWAKDAAVIQQIIDTPALVNAVKNNQTKEANKYLSTGISPDMPDSTGIPLLHIAASNYNAPMIILLRLYGANPNIRDSKGKLPRDFVSKSRFSMFEDSHRAEARNALAFNIECVKDYASYNENSYKRFMAAIRLGLKSTWDYMGVSGPYGKAPKVIADLIEKMAEEITPTLWREMMCTIIDEHLAPTARESGVSEASYNKAYEFFEVAATNELAIAADYIYVKNANAEAQQPAVPKPDTSEENTDLSSLSDGEDDAKEIEIETLSPDLSNPSSEKEKDIPDWLFNKSYVQSGAVPPSSPYFGASIEGVEAEEISLNPHEDASGTTEDTSYQIGLLSNKRARVLRKPLEESEFHLDL